MALGVAVVRPAERQAADRGRPPVGRRGRREAHQPGQAAAARGIIADRAGVRLTIRAKSYRCRDRAERDRGPARDGGALAAPPRPGRTVQATLERQLRGGRWQYFSGDLATQVERLRGKKGVHLEVVSSGSTRPRASRAAPSVRWRRWALSGIESAALDSLLRGTPGLVVNLRDREARIYSPAAGHVRSGIGRRRLSRRSTRGRRRALQRRSRDDGAERARGGEAEFLGPRTVKCLRSPRDRRTARSPRGSAESLTEPGSMAKLFDGRGTAAAVDTATDTVSPEGGICRCRFVVPGRRCARSRMLDVEHVALTLATTIEVSSTSASTKFSSA